MSLSVCLSEVQTLAALGDISLGLVSSLEDEVSVHIIALKLNVVQYTT